MSKLTRSPSGSRKADRRAFKRKRLSDEVSGGIGPATESNWLVSYADMMTLLFGLFVMLYVLAAKKHSNLQDVMIDISTKHFDGKAMDDADQMPGTDARKPNNQVGNADKLVDVQAELDASHLIVADQVKRIEDLNMQVAELRGKADDLKSRLNEREKEKFKKEGTSSSKKSVTEIKTKLDEVERTLAATQSQLNEAQEKNEDLQKNLLSQRAGVQNFMMVMVTWETERHDLDLKIVSPHSKAFDFKHRAFDGEPGRFELDSRLGPGIEMWKAQNFIAGDYRSEVQLYSMNGNSKPARAHFSIYTNHATYNSKSFTLSEAGQKKVLTFKVSEKGDIEMETEP